MKITIHFLLVFLLTPFWLLAQDDHKFEQDYLKKMDSVLRAKDAVLGVNHGQTLYPDAAGKSALTPTGWGSNGTHLFAGLGGTYPQLYGRTVDLEASVGLCTGDAVKFVNVVGIFNVNDVSRFNNFSYGFTASHFIGKTGSVALGGENLFPNQKLSDAGPSYYIVYSHVVQTTPSATPGVSRLSYSIGAGSGHYATKSPKDIEEGKGKYGTIAFGNVSYEVVRNVNVNLEWTGINLGASVGLSPFKNLPGIMVGIADLTRYSGDKPHLVFNIGHSLTFHNR